MTKKPAQIFHLDLYGKRDDKYTFLDQNNMASIKWQELHPQMPELFFVPKDFEVKDEYDKGFSIVNLFPLNSVGIVTARDNFTIHSSKEEVENVINNFLSLDDESARSKFNLGKDVRDWQVKFAKKDLINNYPDKGVFTKVCYRPFDDRWTFYTGKSKGFHCYPRTEVMQHFTKGKNVGLIIGRQGQAVGGMTWNLSFITNTITDFNMYYRGGGMLFPLYLYPEKTEQQTLSEFKTLTGLNGRTPNLNMEIVNQMAEQLGIGFVSEKTTLSEFKTLTGLDDTDKESPNTFAPIDILDYIYAVLHSPNYREKYKEFLKIDFPRVPFPTTLSGFRTLTALGAELRQIHLLESETIENYITEYPEDGNNVVVKPRYEINPVRVLNSDRVVGNVHINDSQYFDNVPEVAWNFYIGGYQPAQKWLKDRKGRELSYEDILHYQKIIVALSETDRIMKEIDTIEI